MSDREVMVETDELRKEFDGVVAVDDLNLQLERGDIFGFIGPNGAGKTTTIRMLATLLKPTSGSAYIGGYDVCRWSGKVRGIIGYMPDSFGVYGHLKVREYLDFFAAAYKIPKRDRAGLIQDCLELTDLSGKRESYIRNLSRGMKQRVCLAKTLVHDPEVLLLDDPASGLDPGARLEIKEILRELGSMGKTVFISSNILPELVDLCSKIGIIEDGRLLASGDANLILSELGAPLVLAVEVHEGMEKAREILERRPDVENIDIKGNILKINYTGRSEDIHEILSELVNENVEVSSFHESSLGLESAFLKLTKGIIS